MQLNGKAPLSSLPSAKKKKKKIGYSKITLLFNLLDSFLYSRSLKNKASTILFRDYFRRTKKTKHKSFKKWEINMPTQLMGFTSLTSKRHKRFFIPNCTKGQSLTEPKPVTKCTYTASAFYQFGSPQLSRQNS